MASGFHDHATALFLLFHDGTDWALLKRAIEREQCAIARAAPDHPGLGVMWARLAEMLEAAAAGRYGVEDNHDELAAIVGAAQSSGFETARLHLVQATIARRRFDREPDLAVLGEAIDAAHRAAESAGEFLVSALMKEADLRHVRWRRADDRDDLDAAVELRLRALEAGPGPAQLSALHAGLCGAYRDRFERFLQVRDIERAVSFGRHSVRSCPEDQGRQRASCLTNLSGAYRTRFEHTRRPKDLRRAVVHARAAVDASPPGDPERPRHLSTLTLALWCGLRFRWDPSGADEAMRASREALELTGTGRHPLRPALLANAANVLRGQVRVDEGSDRPQRVGGDDEIVGGRHRQRGRRAIPAPCRAVRGTVAQVREHRRASGRQRCGPGSHGSVEGRAGGPRPAARSGHERRTRAVPALRGVPGRARPVRLPSRVR
ncbi:hypothetical protein [Lentzea sp. NPDC060358]|uniref:hypothetical protein n=1 Tax=Lentzea sp. NPDC060358 TaxID=3347103 RepID=UPI003649AEEE